MWTVNIEMKNLTQLHHLNELQVGERRVLARSAALQLPMHMAIHDAKVQSIFTSHSHCIDVSSSICVIEVKRGEMGTWDKPDAPLEGACQKVYNRL